MKKEILEHKGCKFCSKCNHYKSLSDFYNCKNYKDKKSYWCKKCIKNYQKIHYSTIIKSISKWLKKDHKNFPWKRTLRDIKARCNNPKNKSYKNYGGKGIKCEITVEELEKLWFRDKAYTMERPSIHRKKSNGNYTLKNCQYIELRKNVEYAHSKGILQFDKNNNLINEYDSVVKASKHSKEDYHIIINYLHSKYIWRYK